MKQKTLGFSALAFVLVSLLVYTSRLRSLDEVSADDLAQRTDIELVEIASHPQSYRFNDQATDHVEGREMVKIHSTAPLASNHKYVELRPGSIRYFRSDGATSVDGKHAAITWSINGNTRTTDIGRPGGVIMVVRSLDGVVSWYSLQMDMRC